MQALSQCHYKILTHEWGTLAGVRLVEVSSSVHQSLDNVRVPRLGSEEQGSATVLLSQVNVTTCNSVFLQAHKYVQHLYGISKYKYTKKPITYRVLLNYKTTRLYSRNKLYLKFVMTFMKTIYMLIL